MVCRTSIACVADHYVATDRQDKASSEMWCSAAAGALSISTVYVEVLLAGNRSTTSSRVSYLRHKGSALEKIKRLCIMCSHREQQ